MAATLRKPHPPVVHVANDVYPSAWLSPAPRVSVHVRLPPAPQPPPALPLPAVLAGMLLGAILFLLGLAAGAVFWVTFDGQIGPEPTPPMTILIPPVEPVSPPPATADIAALPASSLNPPEMPEVTALPPVSAADPRDLQITVRDAAPEEIPDFAAPNSAQELLRQGKAAEAVDWLQDALGQDPDNVLIRLDLAIACDHAGRPRDAVTFYRQVIAAVESAEEHESSAVEIGIAESAWPITVETLLAIRARASYLEELIGE